MRPKLDLKDRKILFELDFDARQSNAEIAKKVGLSKQGVDYKIQNMINKKIILGFYPLINFTKLGYYYGRLLIKFQNLTKEKEEEIYNYAKNNEKSKWVIKLYGTYDLVITYWTKTITEFKNNVDDFVSKYGLYIKEKKGSIGLDITHFQSRYLLNKKETKELHVKEEIKYMDINESDKKILKILCENARISLVEIAKRLKISAKIVAYKLKKLEEKEIILGYRPIINHNLLDWIHYKIFFYLMNIRQRDLDKLRYYFKSKPNVIYIVNELGICDFDIELMLRSHQEFFDFIKELKFTFPKLIKEYDAITIGETLKITYLPFD